MAALDTQRLDFPKLTSDWRGSFQAQQDELERLQAISNALPAGEIVGGIVKFPVADGYAMYRVSSARPLTLQHIDFCDGWQIPAAHLRGLTIADIRAQLDYEKRLNALFGRK